MPLIEVDFTNERSKDFEQKVNAEMDKPIKHFEKELISIRTGRANPAMVEDIKVICYGAEMRLRDTAAITTPDPKLILVQPWDKSLLGEIDKAIQVSGSGLTPVNDGDVIRIKLPEMSSDRRDELAKLLGKKEEEAKVNIRNIRKEFHNLVRDAQKAKQVSEDFSRKLSDILQKITDLHIEKISQLSIKKATEIKAV